MPADAQDIAQKQVTLIPTDRIRILNPRVRNRRTFEEMVENIAKIGLKRPITVAQRAGTDPVEYDLVCGQGRLEAFMELQQNAIPAIIIDADESDCLVMSLVENCARRQHNPIDLMREIGNLRKRGYNDRQIGEKIGVSYEYVNMIAGLLEKGEERLVSAEFLPQFEQALRNVVAVVEAAGGSAQDLVSLTIYVTDKRRYIAAGAELGRIYREVMGQHFPTMALLQVADLLEDGAQVEIQGLAVLPDHDS